MSHEAPDRCWKTASDFVPRQDHWQPGGLFGADDIVKPAEVVVKDFLI